jgi:hypothetical protein
MPLLSSLSASSCTVNSSKCNNKTNETNNGTENANAKECDIKKREDLTSLGSDDSGKPLYLHQLIIIFSNIHEKYVRRFCFH